MIRFGKRELNHTCSISSESKYPENFLDACVRSYIYVKEQKIKKISRMKKKTTISYVYTTLYKIYFTQINILMEIYEIYFYEI